MLERLAAGQVAHGDSRRIRVGAEEGQGFAIRRQVGELHQPIRDRRRRPALDGDHPGSLVRPREDHEPIVPRDDW